MTYGLQTYRLEQNLVTSVLIRRYYVHLVSVQIFHYGAMQDFFFSIFSGENYYILKPNLPLVSDVWYILYKYPRIMQMNYLKYITITWNIYICFAVATKYYFFNVIFKNALDLLPSTVFCNLFSVSMTLELLNI